VRWSIAVANVAHLKLVNRGARRWNQWRKLHLSEGLDLSDADLHGLDLSGINFIGVNLTGANLKSASLKEALLRFADLTSSDCGGADLSGADLTSACLRRVNLSRAQLFKTDLCRADLREADLSHAWGEQSFWIEANLAGANLESANFNQAILTEANFQGANLTKANLSKADLSFINLTMANLSQANLSKVICIEGNISEANLSGINLYCANCQRTNFRGALLHEANLTGGNFGESDFTNADLSFATLKDAKVMNTRFESAKLNDVRWGKENLNATPYEATLEGIQWSLPAAEFSQALQVVESTVLEAAFLSDAVERPSHEGLVQDQSVLEVAQWLEVRSNLILSFPNPIHWVAIATALRQISQLTLTSPILTRIEAISTGETMLSLSISPQVLSGEEFESTLMQRYEALRLTFSQMLPSHLKGTSSESASEESILKDGSVNQLLNLVISNLI
jgi:uncharacterized protein YjbI with pentapeptide repeats